MVWLATATWVAILLAYSLLVPLFRAPDELGHVSLVIGTRTDPGYGDYDSTYIDARVAAGAERVGVPFVATTGQSSAAVPRTDRPLLEDLGAPEPLGRNQQTQHPPLYYGGMGAVSTVVTSLVPGEQTWTIDRLVYLLRVLNVALLAAVPALTYRAARHLGVTIRASVLGSLLVMAVPQVAHIGSAVNSDNLVVLLGAVAAVGAAAVTGGDLTTRRAVGLGIVVGLALLTKATGVVLAGMVAAAYAAQLRASGRTAIARLFTSGGVAFAIAGWWWIKNLIQHGTLQPSDPFWLVQRDVDPVVGDWAERFFYLLPLRFWGQFGILEVKLNAQLVAFGTALVLGCATWAVVRGRSRVRSAVLLVPFGASLVIVARKTWNRYLTGGRPIPGIQGRYLFVGLVGLMTSVAQAADALPPRIARRACVGGIGLLVVMHAVAVRGIVRRFWGVPVERWTDRLDDLRAFSPLPEVVTDALMVTALVSVAGLAAVCIVDALMPSPDADGDGA